MNSTKKIGKILTFASVILTLTITPLSSYDAVNTGRFVALCVFGGIALLYFMFNLKRFSSNNFYPIILIGILFISWQVVSLLRSKLSLEEGLFGISGRYFGLITQVCLVSLMLLSVVTSSLTQLQNQALVLVLTGFVSSLYGIFQFFGLDPISWINPYSPVFSFFGNPNFHSAFMGIVGSTALGLVFFENKSKTRRFLYLAAISFNLINIWLSTSLQGILVFIAGASVVIFYYLLSKKEILKFIWAIKVYVVFLVFLFLAVIADILQKSPWKPILYQESVSLRGDFWRAGYKMTLGNSIFGVGPDGFRDQYRFYRDLTSASRSGGDVPTDSAHNGFLDLSSAGGLPLLIIYLAFVVYALISVAKLTQRFEKTRFVFVPILSGWVAFLAQFLISTNHLALAFWGWVLPGLLIGFELKTRGEGVSKSNFNEEFRMPAIFFLGGALGLSFGLPLFIADASFQASIKSGEVLKIEKSIAKWPRSSERINLASELLRNGNLPERSIQIARDAISFNPLNYESWKELANQPNATDQERRQAATRMKKLDPFNPNLK